MENPIKILHLEDNLSDSVLVQLNLKKENINFEYFFADNEEDFLNHLTNQNIDIILSDYNLPGYSGAEALMLVKTNYQHIPFVFVSGTMGEEAAIESLLNGATDYVLKNHIERLGTAVTRSLRESRLQHEYNKTIDNLRQKEEQYRTLVEGMNEGIMLTDIDDTILFVNQQTCDITGFSEDELIGKIYNEILYDLIARTIILEKNKLREQGIKDIYEIELLRKDHKKIWIRVSGSPVYDIHGKVCGSIGVFENINDRKIAEDELRKLTQTVIQSPDSIMITDTEGIIEYANPTASRLTGYPIKELIGKRTNIFNSEEHSLEEYKHLWKTIKSGNIWEGEFHNRKKTGELYWESATISPIYNSEGAITHFLAIKVDITERNKQTKELILAKEKAEESDRLKSAFLANISHEIRTPMNGILGFAELLKTPELSPDVQERYIHVIEQSGNRMLNIINDIVDISKIEAGQMNVHIEETNVNQLIKDLLIFFTPEAKAKSLQLSYITGLSEDESIILTDHTKLTQILSNLIKNALKFTKSGSIEFGYGSLRQAQGGAGSQSGAGSVGELVEPELEFYVRDTGIGIPANQTEMIFERFRQGSDALNREYEGAGLGLSISKAFVEMLGGKIRVESEPGKGSVFFFQIPLRYQSDEEPGAENYHPVEMKAERFNILITEDDEHSMYYIKILLENGKTNIIEARNGKEAIEAVKTHPEINLVLMDLKMPVMDGFEATRQIKLLRPSLPVIAQTAYAFVEDQEKARLAGCDDCLSKPIKKQLLLDKIQRVKLRL